MALDKNRLKYRIINELRDRGFKVEGTGRDGIHWLELWSDAIATAIIDEITENARAVGEDSDGDSHSLRIE